MPGRPEEQTLFRQDESSRIPLVRLSTCRQCGRRAFPPVFFGCERCGAGAESLHQVELPATGRVLSAVNVPEDSGQFTVAAIELDEGPVVRGLLDEMVEIGEPVRGEVLRNALVFRKTHE